VLFPNWLEPMAATLTQERFTGPEWIFERFLRIRLLAFRQGPNVRLLSRNKLPQSCPSIAAALADLPVRDVILDGEVTWGSAGMVYHVFDILWLNGRDVTALPFDERRGLLDTLPFRSPLERVALLTEAKPWERACSEGWEDTLRDYDGGYGGGFFHHQHRYVCFYISIPISRRPEGTLLS
jgi:ATP-dependent DNA ligase